VKIIRIINFLKSCVTDFSTLQRLWKLKACTSIYCF